MGTQGTQSQGGIQLGITRFLGIPDQHALVALSGLAEGVAAFARVVPLCKEYVHPKVGIGFTILSALTTMVQTLNFTALGKVVEKIDGKLEAKTQLSKLGKKAILNDKFDDVDAPVNLAAGWNILQTLLSVFSRLKSIKGTVQSNILSGLSLACSGALVFFQGSGITSLHEQMPAVADSLVGGLAGQTA